MVGQLAEWHLSRRAAKNINALLGPTSLAMVSTWMDEIRSDSTYNYTNTWHWVTVPPGKTYDPTLSRNPMGDAYDRHSTPHRQPEERPPLARPAGA